MPELGSYGSVRGARGNSRPYRDSDRRRVKTTLLQDNEAAGVLHNRRRCSDRVAVRRACATVRWSKTAWRAHERAGERSGGKSPALRIHGSPGLHWVGSSIATSGWRFVGAAADVSRTRTFAKELVALQPDVILTQGTPGTAALQPETRTIPIVCVVVADPVGPGFVTSLSRPGGNITGFINSEAAIGAKMLELLTEIASGIKRVAMIFDPDTAPGRGTYYYRDFEAAARSVQLEPIEARARSDAEIEAVVTSLGGEPRGGLVVTPDYFMFNHSQQIVSQAARNNVPTIYPWRSVVSKQDGLISYGPDRQHQDTGSPYFDGEPDSLASMDWSRRTFPAERRITIRWKLDLILLNPPNHTSSIPAAGVNFATSL